ncbi:MAG: glycosyltransferase family 39 protein [Candidatus Sulfotelmatobacter sp.]
MNLVITKIRTVELGEAIREKDHGFSRFLSHLEKSARSFSRVLERSPIGFIVGFSLLYFSASVTLAYWKLMWLDELYTYHIAALPSATAIWSKLASGTGPMPPSFYLLTRFSQEWLGPSHFAIRFPELIGFLIASLCLFYFIRRRTSALYGLVGMLAFWITGAYPFAYEARPYGLVLGFCGLALVCWQAASENVRRRWALLGLFAACAGAVGSHYGAVMLVFPLALGELVRSISRRRVDWPVWLAFCGGGLPLLVFLPLLRASISPYGLAMWSRPTASSLLDCYTELLSMAGHPLAAILGVLAIWRAARARGILTGSVRRLSSMPSWEIAAAIGLLLLPVVGLLQAVLVTGQITPRYVLPLVMGFGIMVALLAYENLRDDAVGSLLVAVLLLAGWGSHVRWEYRNLRPGGDRVRAFYRAAAQQPGDLPIVIDDGNRFVQLAHYAPAEFSSRLFYLVDTDAVREYSGTDSTDLCLLRYGRFLPLNLRPADAFLRTGRPFLLLVSSNGWLFPVLQRESAKIELVGMTAQDKLYRIEPNPEHPPS